MPRRPTLEDMPLHFFEAEGATPEGSTRGRFNAYMRSLRRRYGDQAFVRTVDLTDEGLADVVDIEPWSDDIRTLQRRLVRQAFCQLLAAKAALMDAENIKHKEPEELRMIETDDYEFDKDDSEIVIRQRVENIRLSLGDRRNSTAARQPNNDVA